MNVGERVRELRKDRGWSQLDLARHSGLAVETITNIENSNHEPRPSTLRALAWVLKVSVRELRHGAGEGEDRDPLDEAIRALSSKKAREYLAATWGTWLRGIAVQPSAMQEARAFAEIELGIPPEELRERLARRFSRVAEEFFKREFEQRKAEYEYWEQLYKQVEQGLIDPVDAAERGRSYTLVT